MNAIRYLKCWPEFFEELPARGGGKSFDMRRNDRGYQRGDTVVMLEFDPNTKQFTGRWDSYEVTYVLSGWGVAPDHVCMAIKPELRAEQLLAVRVPAGVHPSH